MPFPLLPFLYISISHPNYYIMDLHLHFLITVIVYLLPLFLPLDANPARYKRGLVLSRSQDDREREEGVVRDRLHSSRFRGQEKINRDWYRGESKKDLVGSLSVNDERREPSRSRNNAFRDEEPISRRNNNERLPQNSLRGERRYSDYDNNEEEGQSGKLSLLRDISETRKIRLRDRYGEDENNLDTKISSRSRPAYENGNRHREENPYNRYTEEQNSNHGVRRDFEQDSNLRRSYDEPVAPIIAPGRNSVPKSLREEQRQDPHSSRYKSDDGEPYPLVPSTMLHRTRNRVVENREQETEMKINSPSASFNRKSDKDVDGVERNNNRFNEEEDSNRGLRRDFDNQDNLNPRRSYAEPIIAAGRNFAPKSPPASLREGPPSSLYKSDEWEPYPLVPSTMLQGTRNRVVDNREQETEMKVNSPSASFNRKDKDVGVVERNNNRFNEEEDSNPGVRRDFDNEEVSNPRRSHAEPIPPTIASQKNSPPKGSPPSLMEEQRQEPPFSGYKPDDLDTFPLLPSSKMLHGTRNRVVENREQETEMKVNSPSASFNRKDKDVDVVERKNEAEIGQDSSRNKDLIIATKRHESDIKGVIDGAEVQKRKQLNAVGIEENDQLRQGSSSLNQRRRQKVVEENNRETERRPDGSLRESQTDALLYDKESQARKDYGDRISISERNRGTVLARDDADVILRKDSALKRRNQVTALGKEQDVDVRIGDTNLSQKKKQSLESLNQEETEVGSDGSLRHKQSGGVSEKRESQIQESQGDGTLISRRNKDVALNKDETEVENRRNSTAKRQKQITGGEKESEVEVRKGSSSLNLKNKETNAAVREDENESGADGSTKQKHAEGSVNARESEARRNLGDGTVASHRNKEVTATADIAEGEQHKDSSVLRKKKVNAVGREGNVELRQGSSSLSQRNKEAAKEVQEQETSRGPDSLKQRQSSGVTKQRESELRRELGDGTSISQSNREAEMENDVAEVEHSKDALKIRKKQVSALGKEDTFHLGRGETYLDHRQKQEVLEANKQDIEIGKDGVRLKKGHVSAKQSESETRQGTPTSSFTRRNKVTVLEENSEEGIQGGEGGPRPNNPQIIIIRSKQPPPPPVTEAPRKIEITEPPPPVPVQQKNNHKESGDRGGQDRSEPDKKVSPEHEQRVHKGGRMLRPRNKKVETDQEPEGTTEAPVNSTLTDKQKNSVGLWKAMMLGLNMKKKGPSKEPDDNKEPNKQARRVVKKPLLSEPEEEEEEPHKRVKRPPKVVKKPPTDASDSEEGEPPLPVKQGKALNQPPPQVVKSPQSEDSEEGEPRKIIKPKSPQPEDDEDEETSKVVKLPRKLTKKPQLEDSEEEEPNKNSNKPPPNEDSDEEEKSANKGGRVLQPRNKKVEETEQEAESTTTPAPVNSTLKDNHKKSVALWKAMFLGLNVKKKSSNEPEDDNKEPNKQARRLMRKKKVQEPEEKEEDEEPPPRKKRPPPVEDSESDEEEEETTTVRPRRKGHPRGRGFGRRQPQPFEEVEDEEPEKEENENDKKNEVLHPNSDISLSPPKAKGEITANAFSNDKKAVANAVDKVGYGAKATAINGSEASALAYSSTKGDARSRSETYGDDGAKSRSLAQGSGVALSTSISRGKGESRSMSIAKQNSAAANSMSTNGGDSGSYSFSLGDGKSVSSSVSKKGGNSKALAQTDGKGPAISGSYADGGGTSKAIARARGGGEAFANSQGRDGGESHSVSSAVGGGKSISVSITKGGGRTRADAMGENGGAAASAMQDEEEGKKKRLFESDSKPKQSKRNKV